MSHVKEMVLGLLESPEQYQNHARAYVRSFFVGTSFRSRPICRYAASVILKVTYGKNTPTHASDPDVLQVRKSLARFAMSLRPGAYLVDSLPWLKYLPWYGRELRRGFIEDYTLFHRQLDAVKRQMVRSDPTLHLLLMMRHRNTVHRTIPIRVRRLQSSCLRERLISVSTRPRWRFSLVRRFLPVWTPYVV